MFHISASLLPETLLSTDDPKSRHVMRRPPVLLAGRIGISKCRTPNHTANSGGTCGTKWCIGLNSNCHLKRYCAAESLSLHGLLNGPSELGPCEPIKGMMDQPRKRDGRDDAT